MFTLVSATRLGIAELLRRAPQQSSALPSRWVPDGNLGDPWMTFKKLCSEQARLRAGFSDNALKVPPLLENEEFTFLGMRVRQCQLSR